jgi:hypothetical protein
MTFDIIDSPSSQFLRYTAAKHFVCMSFRATRPDGSSDLLYASCFLVEVEYHWFLVTAGHVITDIRDGYAAGTAFSDFTLHDKLAGNQFPFGVPIPFDEDAWVVFDTLDADIAATPLPSLIIDNLKAGGISPIGEVAWGPPPFENYDHWLLTGIPAETYARMGNQHLLKLTIIPLEPTEPPTEVPRVDTGGVEGGIASDFPAQYGKIITQPGLDQAYVASVKGMSGSPVYGVRSEEGKLKYWLLGIESSWFEQSRIVNFHPSICFFTAFRLAIQQIHERESAARAG